MLVESPRQIGLVLERPELPTRSVNLVQDQSLLIRNINVHPRKIRETSINNSLQQQLTPTRSFTFYFCQKLYHRVLSHLPQRPTVAYPGRGRRHTLLRRSNRRRTNNHPRRDQENIRRQGRRPCHVPGKTCQACRGRKVAFSIITQPSSFPLQSDNLK